MSEKMAARRIVRVYTRDRLCDRPEYYSGRGAILSDLNSKLLEEVYQGIKKEIGEAAAEQFVNMVASIDKLSATCFLSSLYELEASGWVWGDKERVTKAINHIDLGPDDGGRLAIGQATLASWTGGGADRNETVLIASEFLSNHGRPLPVNMWMRPMDVNGG